MRQWIARNRLLSFFLLTFLWSWCWWLSPILSTSAAEFTNGALPPTFFIFAIVGGFGPSIAGIVMAKIVGKDETVALTSALKKTRFPFKWYLFAFLFAPFITGVQALLHALTGREVFFNIAPVMLVMGFVWPVFAAFGEEIGWRGFALPQMLQKYGALKASVILGIIWGFWHLPTDYIAYSNYGLWFIPVFLLFGPINLTAHAVIMTFLYKKTGGSLFAMICYHFSITLCGILTPSFSFSGPADDTVKTMVTVAVFVAAAVLIAVFSKEIKGKVMAG